MKVGLIGRSELMFESACLLIQSGVDLGFIITAKEAPEYSIKSADFERLAKNIFIPFLHTPSLGNDESMAFLRNIEDVDICISVNYSGVIPQSVIDCFPLGILNAHGGDLPRYRGNACQAWALLNEEERIGLCIHRMVGGELDSGDIVAREYLPININTKIKECYDWMAGRIPEMFVSAVTAIRKDNNFFIEKQSSDPVKALRCYPRQPSDGKIDFKRTSEEIIRLINASGDPFAGAFCHYKEVRVTIWDAHLFEDNERCLAMPGQITHIDPSDGSIVVVTGDGKIRVCTIEYQGEKCLPSQVIKGIRHRLY